MDSFGLVQVYTGKGKGKTTAALGAALRAAGQGYKVYIIQFLKGGENFPPYGELKSLERHRLIDIDQFPSSGFVNKGSISDETRAVVRRGLERAKEVLVSTEIDMVVLDEINVVVDLGIASDDEVIEALKQRSAGTEVVLTGRGAPQALIEIADLVSCIDSVKHPLDSGVEARKGIEY